MGTMKLAPALLLLSLTAPVALAQTPTATTATSTLQPSIDKLRSTISTLNTDKWKAPGAVREDARNNISSIRRDIDETLPPLLQTADAAPGSVAANLPVFRNIDALYDVLLRVVETAELAAPDTDGDALRGALTQMEDARRTFGDQLQTAAVNAEAQTKTLNAQLAAAQAAAKPIPTAVVDNTDQKPAPAARKKKKAAPPPQ